jgi:hypothetical protein
MMTMAPPDLSTIQRNFEMLLERLAALIEFHANDPAAVERLQTAHARALAAVEMLRELGQSSASLNL